MNPTNYLLNIPIVDAIDKNSILNLFADALSIIFATSPSTITAYYKLMLFNQSNKYEQIDHAILRGILLQGINLISQKKIWSKLDYEVIHCFDFSVNCFRYLFVIFLRALCNFEKGVCLLECMNIFARALHNCIPFSKLFINYSWTAERFLQLHQTRDPGRSISSTQYFKARQRYNNLFLELMRKII